MNNKGCLVWWERLTCCMNQVVKAITKMPAWQFGASLIFKDFIFRQIITLPLVATSTGVASSGWKCSLVCKTPDFRHLDCFHWWMVLRSVCLFMINFVLIFFCFRLFSFSVVGSFVWSGSGSRCQHACAARNASARSGGRPSHPTSRRTRLRSP